jgi:hypothetical protein
MYKNVWAIYTLYGFNILYILAEYTLYGFNILYILAYIHCMLYYSIFLTVYIYIHSTGWYVVLNFTI